MAFHGHQRRQGQRDAIPTGSIGRPDLQLTLTDGDIATAPEATTFTTAPGAIEIITTIDGQERTTTITSDIPVTNEASFSSIVAAESASRASETAAKTSSAPVETSTAAKDDSSSNLGTLIPAIVVPIVVVLLVSFGAFWFWMRRRHRKELQNTDFAMAGKGEKLRSRSNSGRSGPANGPAEKAGLAATATELPPPRITQDEIPRNSFEALGFAQDSHQQSASRAQSPSMPFSGPGDRGVQNFSGPRPSTARNHLPPRGDSQGQGRNRSNSSPGNRGPPPSGYRGPRGPPPPRDIGPSPIMRNHASPPLGSGQSRGPGPHSQPRAAPTPPGPGRMRAPSPAGINRPNAPAALDAPPPGAYNGASPISQYSPIVKDTPKIGTIASFDLSPPSRPSRDGNRPPPIVTNDLNSNASGPGLAAVAVTKDKSRSPSPRSPDDSALTEENMRIARLANSSRLGFNTTSKPSSPGPSAPRARDFSKPLGYKKGHDSPLMPINTAHSAPGQSPAATSTTNPSPKLPPPATLSQLIPSDSPRDERKPQWNYFGNSKNESPTSSIYSGLPQAGGHSRPLPASRNQPANPNTADNDNASVVSDLDAYEDIDAKSDVSSLNEFERFDFDSTRGSGSVR